MLVVDQMSFSSSDTKSAVSVDIKLAAYLFSQPLVRLISRVLTGRVPYFLIMLDDLIGFEFLNFEL